MRTVDVLLRGFAECKHVQFRSWYGSMDRKGAKYIIFHGSKPVLYVRDPRFGNVKPYIHFCTCLESISELRLVNAFLSGIGCVSRFRLSGKRMEIRGKRKIEPKYLISWIAEMQ